MYAAVHTGGGHIKFVEVICFLPRYEAKFVTAGTASASDVGLLLVIFEAELGGV